MPFVDLRFKILTILFNTIITYDPKFRNKNVIENKDFTYVYFSNYLKRKLPWDLYRIYKPTKIEYDDLMIDKRHVEFDVNKVNLSYINDGQRPITEDFIYLCRLINKHKYDDLFGEIMMLRYGYDYNSIKIAKLLQVRKKCVEKYLEQLIDFWRENKEYLGE